MSGSRADIFISYAHNDNRGSNWVSAFARQLDFALTRRLGRKPTLFLDDQRLAGNETERVFEREAAAARLFVPILSPSFVERRHGQETSWPLRELSAFLTQPGALDRVYPVEFLPLSDARLPAALQQKIRKHRFWQSLPESGPDIEIPIDPVDDQRAFNLRIEELAARLARHLEDLARTIAPEAGPTAASAEGGTAVEGGQAPDARRKAVLLGQVTFDLEDEQARLRSYLEQFGFRVLPEDTLPQGAQNSPMPSGPPQQRVPSSSSFLVRTVTGGPRTCQKAIPPISGKPPARSGWSGCSGAAPTCPMTSAPRTATRACSRPPNCLPAASRSSRPLPCAGSRR